MQNDSYENFVIKARLELFIVVFFSLLFNRSTDRPTHFREEGGDGGGGGLEKGKPFPIGGLRV